MGGEGWLHWRGARHHTPVGRQHRQGRRGAGRAAGHRLVKGGAVQAPPGPSRPTVGARRSAGSAARPVQAAGSPTAAACLAMRQTNQGCLQGLPQRDSRVSGALARLRGGWRSPRLTPPLAHTPQSRPPRPTSPGPRAAAGRPTPVVARQALPPPRARDPGRKPGRSCRWRSWAWAAARRALLTASGASQVGWRGPWSRVGQHPCCAGGRQLHQGGLAGPTLRPYSRPRGQALPPAPHLRWGAGLSPPPLSWVPAHAGGLEHLLQRLSVVVHNITLRVEIPPSSECPTGAPRCPARCGACVLLAPRALP